MGRQKASKIFDFKEITENQLKKFGVKYHLLKTNKPYYDVLIDDRARDYI